MAKTKTCSLCNKEFEKLWYSNPKCCPSGQCRKLYSELKSKKGTCTPEKKKTPRIKPISDKKRKELFLYRRLRDEYMKRHPICEWCQAKPSLDLHHKMPRAYHLLDVSVYSALCRECHNRCEIDHQAAREAGFKIDHLSKK